MDGRPGTLIAHPGVKELLKANFVRLADHFGRQQVVEELASHMEFKDVLDIIGLLPLRLASQIRLRDFSLTELRFRINSGERVAIPLIAFQRNTGEQTGGAIECLPGKHPAGRCLYGADFEIPVTGVYRVTFAIELADSTEGRKDLLFDVYENWQRKVVLAQNQPSDVHPRSPTCQTAHLDFMADKGFRVEFRIFWHGRTRIRVMGVYLERLAERVTGPSDENHIALA